MGEASHRPIHRHELCEAFLREWVRGARLADLLLDPRFGCIEREVSRCPKCGARFAILGVPLGFVDASSREHGVEGGVAKFASEKAYAEYLEKAGPLLRAAAEAEDEAMEALVVGDEAKAGLAQVRRGDALLGAGELTDALEAFSQARGVFAKLSQHKEEGMALKGQADACAGLGRLNEALRTYECAIAVFQAEEPDSVYVKECEVAMKTLRNTDNVPSGASANADKLVPSHDKLRIRFGVALEEIRVVLDSIWVAPQSSAAAAVPLGIPGIPLDREYRAELLSRVDLADYKGELTFDAKGVCEDLGQGGWLPEVEVRLTTTVNTFPACTSAVVRLRAKPGRQPGEQFRPPLRVGVYWKGQKLMSGDPKPGRPIGVGTGLFEYHLPQAEAAISRGVIEEIQGTPASEAALVLRVAWSLL